MVQVSSLFRGYVVLNKEMKKKNPSKGDNSIASSGLWCLNHEYSAFCLLTFASMAK